MNLTLVSAQHELNHTIVWIEINTDQGNYVIEEGHIPFIMPLSFNSSILYKLSSGKEETVDIASGIAHIQRDKVTIVMQSNVIHKAA